MFVSVGKVLPAVLAPLIIAELHADPAWVGVYYGISAAASLVVQMGCGFHNQVRRPADEPSRAGASG